MKKILLFLLFALLAIPSAEAKRRETAEEIEMKTRHYKGWEWGASARAHLIFYELDYMRVNRQPAVSAYKAHAKFGGSVLLNGGYFINNHWKVGMELGAQMQNDYTSEPIYATAHYYYGACRSTPLPAFVVACFHLNLLGSLAALSLGRGYCKKCKKHNK